MSYLGLDIDFICALGDGIGSTGLSDITSAMCIINKNFSCFNDHGITAYEIFQ